MTANGEQNWDFSSMPTENVADTMFLINPTEAPEIDSFPAANFVAKIKDLEDTTTLFVYLIKNTDSLVLIGMSQHDTTGMQTIYSWIQEYEFITEFPLTYNTDELHHSYKQDIIFKWNDTVDFHLISTVTDTLTSDAWGTLTLPEFPAVDVIRLHKKGLKIDSLYIIINDTSSTFMNVDSNYFNTYTWFTNDENIRFKICEYNEDDDSTFSFTNAVSVVADFSRIEKANNVKIYPNPVFNVLYINNIPTECEQFEILDYNGKIIKKINVSGSSATFDVSRLPQGIYFLKINNSNISKKFIVE